MGGGFLLRRIMYQGALMVNVCEADLVGRTLVEGELKVDLNPLYFSGEEVDLAEAVRAVEQSDIANLVGGTIVGEVLRRGLAHPGAVRTIGGVPFLMIYKFSANYGRR